MSTDMVELLVRRSQPGDRPTLVELNAYGLAAVGLAPEDDAYGGADFADFDGTYGDAAGGAMLVGELRVSEERHALVAMGGLRRLDPEVCEILRMRVWPAHQSQGYGRTMLRAVEAEAIRLGYRMARLLTGEFQHPAIDLYRSAGYRVSDRLHASGIPSVHMTKNLPAGEASTLP